MNPRPAIAPESHRRTLEDRFADWLADRIFNDRELDHGLLMILIGIWIAAFHATQQAAPWWGEVFSVLPPWAWATLLIGTGLARVVLARWDRGGAVLAAAALGSCFLLAFMAILTGVVRWQMLVTPILGWCAYQAIKSHARLMLNRRRTGAGRG